LVKIEVQIYKLDPGTGQYAVYNNLQPQTAMVTGNNYSAAAYLNLPAGTYRIVSTMYYTSTTNGVTTNLTVTSTEQVVF
jgi:hypothetical protein